MPSPEQIEYATILLRRAKSDLAACRLLADNAAMSDDVVGFHAQQAVEKAVKAVLVLHGIEFPRTHDLDFLIDLASDDVLELPDAVAAVTWLSPWAAQLRYDEPSGELDRDACVSAAQQAVGWASGAVAEG